MNYYPDSATPGKQRGGALIMLAVILILTVSLVVMSRMGRNGDELERQEDANTLLAKARDAIISIAVTNNVLPGMLVYPDRSDDDGIFDGGADCSGSNPVTNNLALTLGRLPYSEQTLAPGAAGGCTRLDISLDLNQSTYNLHYVVSPNLVQHNYNGLNNQINANVVSNNDGNPNVIDDNWLSVYDSNGNLLSDRVAFLIFYPGSALTTSTNHAQNRSGNTPGPGEFLDSATISINGAATLIDNANATDLRFVKAAPSATFNDKLIFVTAEELMRKVEFRMLNEAAIRLAALPCTIGTAFDDFDALNNNWDGTGNNTYDASINNTAGYSLASVTYNPPANSGGNTGNGNNGNGGNGNNGNGNGNNGNNGNGGNGNNGNGNGNNGNNGNGGNGNNGNGNGNNGNNGNGGNGNNGNGNGNNGNNGNGGNGNNGNGNDNNGNNGNGGNCTGGQASYTCNGSNFDAMVVGITELADNNGVRQCVGIGLQP